MDDQPLTPLKIRQLLKFALYTFWISFIIGSILLLIFLSDAHTFGILIYVGIAYVEFAIVFNFLLLIIMLVMALLHKQHSTQIFYKAALLLCNIPIAIAYFFIAFLIITKRSPF